MSDLGKCDFKTWQISPFEELPNIELYMDQLLFILERELKDHLPAAVLSSAMINNYIKEGHLPRTKKKRYEREQVALLILLAQLKTVLTVTEAGRLLEDLSRGADDEAFAATSIAAGYETFREILEDEARAASERLQERAGNESQAELALHFAIQSLVTKRVAELLLAENSVDDEK